MSVVTKGPLRPPRESLAGFWIVDVHSEEREIDIAARISQAAESPRDVRQCMDAPENIEKSPDPE